MGPCLFVLVLRETPSGGLLTLQLRALSPVGSRAIFSLIPLAQIYIEEKDGMFLEIAGSGSNLAVCVRAHIYLGCSCVF